MEILERNSLRLRLDIKLNWDLLSKQLACKAWECRLDLRRPAVPLLVDIVLPTPLVISLDISEDLRTWLQTLEGRSALAEVLADALKVEVVPTSTTP